MTFSSEAVKFDNVKNLPARVPLKNVTQIQKSFESHPDYIAAKEICHSLNLKGFQAFLAGGSVRDLIIGSRPNDFDVATDATPEQIEGIFPATVAVGKAFGTIRVQFGEASIEVTTFRKDKEYLDGRHPNGVEFSDPEEDAKRRDFTINALFFNLQSQEIIDYCNGIQDIQNKLIRAVGLPEKRFGEDALRLLRALRFASQLGFEIELKTWQAILQLHEHIKAVSFERVRDELIKFFKGQYANKTVAKLVSSNLLSHLIPEVQFDEKRYLSVYLEVQNDCEALVNLFAWMGQCAQNKISQEDFEVQFKRLRISKQEQLAITKQLFSLTEPNSVIERPLGFWIKRAFDPDYRKGLDHFALFESNQELQRQVDLIIKKSQGWSSLPEAFLKAKDLFDLYSGAKLGEALQLAYHKQLEGVVKDAKEALHLLKNAKL